MLLQKITLAAVALATLFTVGSCKESGKGGGELLVAGLNVSGVTATYGSVTFTVDATPAVAVAYICLPKGQTITAKDIFAKGTAKGEAKGTYTVSGLAQNTEYTLFVAKRDKSLEGPSSVDFKTTLNGGTPETPTSAGIRVETVDKTTAKVEILNGTEADYSFVGIWPEPFIENFVYEGSKKGVSRDEYLKGLILGYPFLCAQVVGRDKSTLLDYTKDFGENKGAKLFPASDYLIITLGMQGKPELGKDGKPGNITTMKIHTEAFELQGNPSIVIDTLYTDYIRVRYKFLPSADAACYAFFATKKAEIDDFIQHFDGERGAGQGLVMLREFVRFIDAFAPENTEAQEYSLSYGFDQEGIDFEMLAVPMDRNMMPGQLVRRVDQVRPMPKNQVYGRYEFKVDPENKGIGATNYWYSIKFEENCANIFWRLTTQVDYDKEVARLGKIGYARDLWNQGWGEDRPSNPKQDKQHSETHFRWGVEPGREYIIVATSLNYTGGLADPKIVGNLKTKSVVTTGGPAEPQMEIQTVAVGKTSVTCRYFVPEGVDPNVPRVIRHIILEEGDAALKLDDKQFKTLLYYGIQVEGSQVIGNEWSVFSTDDIDADHRFDWQWTWNDMKSGQKYVYSWLTEDLDGKFSEIKRITLQTARNDGGPNPKIDITIDPATIMTNPSNSQQWGCKAKFNPNNDAVRYIILFSDRAAVESHGHKTDTKEHLEAGLTAVLMAMGMSGVDPSTIDGYTMTKGSDAWATAITYGAANVQGALTYRLFKADGTVGPLIEAPISASQSVRIRNSAPLRGLEELKARNARVKANISNVEILPPFAAGEPQAYQKMHPEQGDIQVRSMSDITRDILSRANYR